MVGGMVGAQIDARQVALVEKFSGMGAGSYAASFDPGFLNYGLLKNTYDKLMGEFSTRFIAQGTLGSMFGNTSYSFSDDKLKFSISNTQILTNATANAPTDVVDKVVYWAEIARVLLGNTTDFGVATTEMQTAIDVAAGHRVQFSVPLSSNIISTSGNDSIDGNKYNNIIDGGAGNDTIDDKEENNVIYGGEGDDKLSSSLMSGANRKNNIVYGDAGNDIINGGDGASWLYGGIGNDTIRGGAGNDSIYGGSGANILRGGLGNDLLKGGEDSDTYFYAKGDGNDVIVDFVYSTLQGVLRLENIVRGEASFASMDINRWRC